MPSGLEGSSSTQSKQKRKKSQSSDQAAKKSSRTETTENNSKPKPMNSNNLKPESETALSKLQAHLGSSEEENMEGISQRRSSRSRRPNKSNENEESSVAAPKASRKQASSAAPADSFSMLSDLMLPFGGLMGSMPPRIKKAIEGLSSASAAHVLKSLEELNEYMMMTCDDFAFSLRIDQLVSSLIQHLRSLEPSGPGDDPSRRTLLCAQILSVLLDSSPAACHSLARSVDSLSVLCDHVARVLLVELSDQCVVVLSRMAKDHGEQLIRAGALMAVLQSIEFFCMSTQRQCIQIVSDLLENSNSDLEGFVSPVLFRLGELLAHPDTEVSSKIAVCWRAAAKLAKNPDCESLSPVLTFLTSSLPSSAAYKAIVEGIESLAGGPVSAWIASSKTFVDTCILTPIRMHADELESSLKLVSSLLPPIGHGKSGDLMIQSPVIPLLEEVVGLILSESVRSELTDDVLHLCLVHGLAGGKFNAETQTSVLLSLIKSSLSGDAMLALKALTLLSLLDCVSTDSVAKEGILDSLSALSQLKAKRKTVGGLVQSKAKSLTLKFKQETKTSFQWTGGLEELLASSVSDFEFLKSDCLTKLVDFIEKPEEVMAACAYNPVGADRFIQILGRLVDQETMKKASLAGKERISKDQLAALLNRPIRLQLSVNGMNLSVLVDPMTACGSLSKFSPAAGFMDWDDYDEEEGEKNIASQEDSDEEEVAGDEAKTVRMNGIVVDKSWSVMQAIVETAEIGNFDEKKSNEIELGDMKFVPGEKLELHAKSEQCMNPILAKIWAQDHIVDVGEGVESSGNLESRSGSPDVVGVSVDSSVVLSDLHHVRNKSIDTKDVWSQLAVVLGMFSLIRQTSESVCPKLNLLFIQAMSDPISVATGKFPLWTDFVVKHTPWLLSTQAKRETVQSKFIGIRRALIQKFAPSGLTIQRQKVGIERHQLLVSALVMMTRFGHETKSVIEVEFLGEAGTGSGPTNEFYSSLVELMTTEKMEIMFRTTVGGLFPSVQRLTENEIEKVDKLMENPHEFMATSDSSPVKILAVWRLLGITLGRAILDSRLVDIEFNPVFWYICRQMVEGKEVVINEGMLRAVEPAMANSVAAMTRMTDDELRGLEIDGSVLPGNNSFKLASETFTVSKETVDQFSQTVTRAHLYDGVIAQVREFTAGFTKVVSKEVLSIVSPEEMSGILRGSALTRDELWSPPALMQAIRADHGYTLQSQQVKDLVEIMSEFGYEDRLKFVKFVTGSRTLPPGGFAGLKPMLTVVKAVTEGVPDSFLPSVMTCANFMKIPEYSNREVMKHQLIKAMNEGQNSFLLS